MKTSTSTILKTAQDTLAGLRRVETEFLFDFLDDVQFWIKDCAGRYLRVNRAFQLNYSLATPDEAVGLTDFDLSPPWLAEAYRADDERVLLGERVSNRIELVGGFDQTTHWFRTSKVPVHDMSGRVAATSGITQPLPTLCAEDFPVPELAPALTAMHDNPAHGWTNADLAGLAGLSVSTFERSFRKHLKNSPMQFLKRLRVARAAAALIQTENPISEIANTGGFSDQAHLSRDFRRIFGCTPSHWRARNLTGLLLGDC